MQVDIRMLQLTALHKQLLSLVLLSYLPECRWHTRAAAPPAGGGGSKGPGEGHRQCSILGRAWDIRGGQPLYNVDTEVL
jgi:hypothetical protein